MFEKICSERAPRKMLGVSGGGSSAPRLLSPERAASGGFGPLLSDGLYSWGSPH